MCKRYVSPNRAAIESEFDLVRSEPEFPDNFNVSPLQAVPVIRVIDEQPDLALLAWGFGEPVTVAVPVEFVSSTAQSHGLLARGQRCILPALGFYVWRSRDGGAGQSSSEPIGGARGESNGEPNGEPFFLHVEDQAVFGFAGFWEGDSCVLVTLPSNEMLARLDPRARMPCILTREMRDVWLYGSAVRAADALMPYAAEGIMAYAVSARVNSPANNDETLVEPLMSDTD